MSEPEHLIEVTSFGDWRNATPSNMRTWTVASLYRCMEMSGGSIYDSQARAELVRRQTDEVDKSIKRLNESIKEVRAEVQPLKESSLRLEGLTETLKRLTRVLIVLTILAFLVPVGIEIWKAYRETPKETPKAIEKVSAPPPSPPQP